MPYEPPADDTTPSPTQLASNVSFTPPTDNAKPIPEEQGLSSVVDAVSMATHLADVYGVAQEGFSKDVANYEAAAGRKTWEQVEQDFTPGRTQVLRQNRINQFEASVSPDVVHKFGSTAIDFFTSALPPVADALVSGAEFGTAGAATGAAVGAVAAPETAGMSAVMGAKYGFEKGFDAGVMKSAVISLTGHLYGEQRARGIPHDQAVNFSLAGGALEALIFRARLNTLGEGGINNLQWALKAQPSKAVFAAFTARLARDMGIAPGTIGAAQGLVDIGTQYISAVVANGKVPTQEEIVTTVVNAALQNIALNTPAHGTALALGGMANIVSRFKGKPLDEKITVDQQASNELARKLTIEATDAHAAHRYIYGRIQEIGDSGQEIPQDVWDQFIESKQKLESAESKAAKAIQDAKTLAEYESLPVEERLTAAQKDHKKWSNHLETLAYAIEQIEAEGNGIPDSMILDRKLSRQAMREASDKIRKAELEIERDSIQEKLNKPGAGDVAKANAEREFSKVNEELRKIKETAVLRGLTEKRDALQMKLQDAEDRYIVKPAEPGASLELANDPEMQAMRAKETVYKADNAEVQYASLKGKALINKLKDQIKQVDYLYDFTHTEALSPETLDSLHGEVSTKKLRGIATKLKRGLLAATRDTEKNSRTTLADAQRQANRLVRLSGLPVAKRGMLKQFKQLSGKTVAESLKAYADYVETRVAEIQDKIAADKADEHLEAALEETKPKNVTKQVQGAPHIQAWLSLYRELLEDPTKAKQILEDATELTDEDITTPVEPGAVSPASLLAIAADVLEVTTTEAKNDLAERIIDLAETGKEATLDKIRKRELTGKVIENTVMDALPEAGKPFKFRNFITKHLRVGNDLWISTWDFMRDTMLMFQREKYNKAFHLLSFNEAVDGARADTSEWMNKLNKALITDENGKQSPKLAAQLVRNSIPRDRPELPEGLQDVNDGTLIQLLAYHGDPRLANRIREGNGITQEDINHIYQDVLNEAQRGMVDKLKTFYQDLYKEMNDHHIKVFGYALKNNPQYAGPAYATFEDSKLTSNDFMKELYSNRSVLPGFIRDQTNNKRPIELNDMYVVAETYVRDAMRWKNWTEEKNGLPSAWQRAQVFKNSDKIKGRVENTLGEKFLQQALIAIDDMTGIKPVHNAEIPFITEANKATGAIVGNVFQLVKQTAGISNYAGFMPVADLNRLAWKVATNLDTYLPIFKEFDFIKSREKFETEELTARIRDARNQLNVAQRTAMQGLRLIQALQGEALHIADFGNVILGGGALYLYAKELGFSDNEARMLMAHASGTTQGSSSIDQRTPMERNTFGEIWSKFQKPNIQTHLQANIDLKRFINNPTPDNLVQAMQSGYAVRAAEIWFTTASSVSGIAAASMVGDEKKLEEAQKRLMANIVIAGTIAPASGIPLLDKQLLAGTMQYVLKDALHAEHNEFSPPSAAVLNGIEQMTKLIANSADLIGGHKLATPEVIDEMVRESNRSWVLYALKINAEDIRNTFDFFKDMKEGYTNKTNRIKAQRRAQSKHTKQEHKQWKK